MNSDQGPGLLPAVLRLHFRSGRGGIFGIHFTGIGEETGSEAHQQDRSCAGAKHEEQGTPSSCHDGHLFIQGEMMSNYCGGLTGLSLANWW
jgi:hypothetical protein